MDNAQSLTSRSAIAVDPLLRISHGLRIGPFDGGYAASNDSGISCRGGRGP
jgi:hypothetical protein